MKRLMRILLNVATVLSLLAVVLSVVIWVRSYGRVEGVTYLRIGSEKKMLAVGWTQGRLILARITDSLHAGEFPGITEPEGWRTYSGPFSDYPYVVGPIWNVVSLFKGDPDAELSSRLFGIVMLEGRVGEGPFTIIWIPSGYLMASGALFPLWRITFAVRNRRRRNHRARNGRCLRCGYDLRAMPEANGTMLARCPECGAERGLGGG